MLHLMICCCSWGVAIRHVVVTATTCDGNLQGLIWCICTICEALKSVRHIAAHQIAVCALNLTKFASNLSLQLLSVISAGQILYL